MHLWVELSKYQKQFLSNFLIQTLDEKYILVRSSNSFRQDRIKSVFYDFQGITTHSDFSDKIIAAAFLVPDKETNSKSFKTIKKKIREKEFYSPATHLFGLSEFFQFLLGLEYSYTHQNDNEEEKVALENLLNEDSGSFYGKRGNLFEREITSILKDYTKLVDYKNGQLKKTEIFFLIVDLIIKKKKIKIENIIKINATNSIPLLANGGNAKTDILIKFYLLNGEIIKATISVKNTNANRVTCHDYKGEDYIRVMDCEGNKLGYYFKKFQDNPSLKSFSKSLKANDSIDEFKMLLLKKKEIFISWVLTGKYDTQNIIDESIQVSEFLFISKNNQHSFYDYKNYISLITENSHLTFGVPFSWTYPSKQRGKRIQLKMPIIV